MCRIQELNAAYLWNAVWLNHSTAKHVVNLHLQHPTCGGARRKHSIFERQSHVTTLVVCEAYLCAWMDIYLLNDSVPFVFQSLFQFSLFIVNDMFDSGQFVEFVTGTSKVDVARKLCYGRVMRKMSDGNAHVQIFM